MLDLKLLAKELDDCLEKETSESLNEWLNTIDKSAKYTDSLIIDNNQPSILPTSQQKTEIVISDVGCPTFSNAA